MSKHNPPLSVFTSLVLAFFATLSNIPIQCTAFAKAHSGLPHSAYMWGLWIVFQEPRKPQSPPGDLAHNDLPTGVTHVIVSARIRVSGDLASSPKHKNYSCERYLKLKKCRILHLICMYSHCGAICKNQPTSPSVTANAECSPGIKAEGDKKMPSSHCLQFDFHINHPR